MPHMNLAPAASRPWLARRTFLTSLICILAAGALSAQTWTPEQPTADWTVRTNHQALAYDDGTGEKLWVIAGRANSFQGRSDVWHSPDGINWTRATTDWNGAGSSSGSREGHAALVFNDGTGEKMWILGGMDLTWQLPAPDNGSWHSSNGINWTQTAPTSRWSIRSFHAAAVFDDGSGSKMWVLGGKPHGGNPLNDVWSSPDGTAWTQVTTTPGWAGRYDHQAVRFDNKLWVLGGVGSGTGNRFNDMWYTTDGSNWTQSTPSGSVWSPRGGHTVAVYNNKMWVVGGLDANGSSLADVWSTTDGVNWTEETSLAPWTARNGHASTVFDNRLWVMGGRDVAYTRDVWSFVDATPSPPSITSTPVTSVEIGSTYSYTLTADGNPSPNFSVNASDTGFPSWLNLAGDTLSGTPQVGDEGQTITITITANNSQGSDSQNFTIDVNLAPDITSTAPATATAGQTYTYTIAADGFPAPNFGVSGNPSWLSLTGNVLSGTPAAVDIGTTGNITLTAANGIGSDDTEVFQIVVGGVTPSFTSSPVTTATAGSSYTYTVTADGAPTPTLSAPTKPNWLTFDPNTGELTGTPGAGDIGATGNDVVIEATNSQGTVTQSFTIQVDGVPPQITSTAVTTATIGLPYTYTVTATGLPAPTLSESGLPGWLNFNATTGVLSGTPTGVGTTGQIDITAANGWSPDDTQSFTIQVNGVVPVITSSAPATAIVGQLYSYTIAATGNPAPTFGVSGNPAWLTLTGSVLSGTPAVGDIGVTGNITVTATNVQGSDDEVFQIQVEGVPPQITSSPVLTATGGTPYTYNVTASGIPAPTLSAAGLPLWLTFNPATGELSGTPNNSNEGANGPITITASNGWGTDAAQTFSITVGKAISGGGDSDDGGGCAGKPGNPRLPMLLIGLLLGVAALARHRQATRSAEA